MTSATRSSHGSVLLGRELRRLRGSRRLDDIAQLTHGGLLVDSKPLSVSTLSELENGKYLPNLELLVTLCLAYRTSPAAFVRRVLEERLSEGQDVPEDREGLEAEAVASMRAERWPRALALVIAGEERAQSEAERVRWRLRHAQVLTNVGMLDQAVLELQAALDSPALPPGLRGRVHLDVANAASRAGHLTEAALHCEAALRRIDEDAPLAVRVRALQTAIAVTLRRSEAGQAEERDLREAARRIEQGRALLAPDDAEARLGFDVYAAQVEHRLGHRVQALELYRRIEKDCGEDGNPHLLACLLISHAELLLEIGHDDAARLRLTRATRLAADGLAPDHAFEAHRLLMTVARNAHEREMHRRACSRFVAQATSATPRMRAFLEASGKGGAR